MKIYTADFNVNQPTLKQIGIPNYSDAKIGINVEKNGEKIELGINDVTLVDGENIISADGEYNGYVTFPISTGDCGDDNSYTLSVNAPKVLIDADILLVTPLDTPIGTTLSVEYSLSDMVGQELNADSIQVLQRYNDTIELINFLNIIDSNNRVIKMWQSPKTQSTPSTEPIWSDYRTTTGRVKSIRIEEGWRLASWCSASSLSKGKTREIRVYQAEYTHANFNLNVNSTKSSILEPDVDENAVKEIMAKDTVVLSGTYADDTTFSFTIPVIK